MSSKTYCYNLNNNAMTQWDGAVFSRIWRLGNRYFGIRENGVYALTGDTDDGEAFDAYAALSPNDFSSDRLKRLPTLTIDCIGTGTASVVADAESSSGITQFENAKRVKLGRGIKGRLLMVDVLSSDADFEVTKMTLYPEVLQRGVN